MEKIETGVMVMKDGNAWGLIYKDGANKSYGWVAPAFASIHDPKFCSNVTDVTYPTSRDIVELRKGTLVSVKRVTSIEVSVLA